MATPNPRRPPVERMVIEELRFFLDPKYCDQFTNFVLTPALQFKVILKSGNKLNISELKGSQPK